MYTFERFLQDEQEGRDPREEMRLDRGGLPDMTNQINVIMTPNYMETKNPMQTSYDPNTYTFLDLLEALNIVEEILKKRFSYSDDDDDIQYELENAKNDFDRILPIYFAGEDSRTVPKFIRFFIDNIAKTLVDAFERLTQNDDPNNASDSSQRIDAAVSQYIKDIKGKVIRNQMSMGDFDSNHYRRLMMQYRRVRDRMVKSDVSQRTKKDRTRLLMALGKLFQAESPK